MKWTYQCKKCGAWGTVDWAQRKQTFTCHACKYRHVPPTPAEQHQAYVDTHNWPDEMEEEVRSSKDNACTVPDCRRHGNTLDHRVPYPGGKTSVDNLFPMCTQHNSAKGEQDYNTWLASLRRAAMYR